MSEELFQAGEVVSRVKADAKDATLVHVYVGSRKRGSLPAADAERLGVKAGAAWTAELSRACEVAINTRRAVRRATGWLASGELSVAQLRERLQLAGFWEVVIDATIGKLAGTFAQRDGRAAEASLQKLIRRLPASTQRMHDVLESKGIGDDDAAAAIAEATGGESDESLARRAAFRVFEGLPKALPPEAAWRRVLAALGRRGFGEDVAFEAARAVLGEPPEGAERGGQAEELDAPVEGDEAEDGGELDDA
ncbi:MAG: hypothetical protein GC200_10645 [Tepidisphaera sp.]|nr:hypothetical protein [Tepidisphaera sp.]